jgi:hypothetical protein
MITEAVKQPAKPAIALLRPHQFLRQHLLKVISSSEDPQAATGRQPFGGKRIRTGAFTPNLLGVSVSFEFSYNSLHQPRSWMFAFTGYPSCPLRAPPSNVGKICAMFRSPINLKSPSK